MDDGLVAREHGTPRQEAVPAALWHRAVLQSHPDAIVLVDPQTARPVYFNDQAHRQLGYSREEFLGLSLADIDAVESPEEIRATIARVMAGETLDFDTVHLTKQGALRDVHVIAHPVQGDGFVFCYCTWRDITDRKRVEAALRVSEERLSRAQRSAGAGTWDWDIRTERLVWSQELFELFGLDAASSQASFDTWRSVLHPDDRPAAEQRIEDSVQSRAPLYSEYRVVRPGGEVRWIAALGNTSYAVDGQPLRMAGICLDITDRKRAETALLASERRYRSLFEHMAEGFAYCRMVFEHGEPVDFVYLAVNEAFSGLTGLRDVVGKRVTDVIPGIRTTDADLFERYARVATSGSPERFEYHLAALDMWFELSVYSPGDGEFVAVFTVITERKRAEAELRESQQKFQSIAEHVTDLIALTDGEGTITYASPASQRLFGLGPDEMTGRHFSEFLDGPSIPLALSHFRRAVGGDQEPTRRLELQMKRADGSTFVGELDGAAYRAGDSAGTLVTIRDVTDRRQALQERRALEAQLSEAQRLEAIGRLAGGVAHDFNNMLSVIMGHAELALRRLDPATPLREDLVEIQAAAERSVELTRQLLAFARRQTVAPKVIDLNEAVGGLLKMLGRLIGENIRLAWSPCRDIWSVRIDPSQVSQVLTNLVANARDAISGVGTVRISTENRSLEPTMPAAPGRQSGDYVLLTVRDDGAGMTSEVVEHVFEPFFTTKPVGEGTGLGLATVYGIVQQNGGFIDVKTAPGAGTDFTIGLPRWTEPAGVAEPIARPSRPGHETLLLVEDEPAILKMSARMLSELGYRVLEAETPAAALRLADAHPGAIHLLISDVIMPEMNGRDLARRLRSRRPDMKRLFVSGYPADVIAHQGILEEGVHFLQKPFTLATLSETVREALEHP